MNKKVLFSICAVVIVAAIAVMLIFALGGGDDADVQVNIEGTWKVVAYTNGSNTTLIDDEFMVFTEDTAKDFRGDADEPYSTSSYSIEKNTNVLLPERSMEYMLEKRTDNYIRLCEREGVYMDLIRYPRSDMGELSFDTESINGRWDIVFRYADNYAGEYLVFEGDSVSDYRAGSSEPSATAEYSWQSDNCFVVDAWGKKMMVYQVSESEIILVEHETETGYVWELRKGK